MKAPETVAISLRMGLICDFDKQQQKEYDNIHFQISKSLCNVIEV